MPAVVIPQTLLAVVKGTFLGEEWNNVIGLRADSNVFMTQTIANEIAAAVHSLYNTWKVSLTEDWVLNEVVIQDLQSALAPSWDAVVSPLVGTSGSTPFSPNVAVVASHRTGNRGRSYRGRTYLNGWGTHIMEQNGQIGSGTRTAVAAAWDTFRGNLGNMTGAPMQHAVVSRTLLVSTPVTATTVDTELDHQDRRKRRG